jgi:hypothetical protein
MYTIAIYVANDWILRQATTGTAFSVQSTFARAASKKLAAGDWFSWSTTK